MLEGRSFENYRTLKKSSNNTDVRDSNIANFYFIVNLFEA